MPANKPARRRGTVYKRTSRPPWRPQRGERILGIPEPVGFAIVLIVVILAIIFIL